MSLFRQMIQKISAEQAFTTDDEEQIPNQRINISQPRITQPCKMIHSLLPIKNKMFKDWEWRKQQIQRLKIQHHKMKESRKNRSAHLSQTNFNITLRDLSYLQTPVQQSVQTNQKSQTQQMQLKLMEKMLQVLQNKRIVSNNTTENSNDVSQATIIDRKKQTKQGKQGSTQPIIINNYLKQGKSHNKEKRCSEKYGYSKAPEIDLLIQNRQMHIKQLENQRQNSRQKQHMLKSNCFSKFEVNTNNFYSKRPSFCSEVGNFEPQSVSPYRGKNISIPEISLECKSDYPLSEQQLATNRNNSRKPNLKAFYSNQVPNQKKQFVDCARARKPATSKFQNNPTVSFTIDISQDKQNNFYDKEVQRFDDHMNSSVNTYQKITNNQEHCVKKKQNIFSEMEYNNQQSSNRTYEEKQNQKIPLKTKQRFLKHNVIKHQRNQSITQKEADEKKIEPSHDVSCQSNAANSKPPKIFPKAVLFQVSLGNQEVTNNQLNSQKSTLTLAQAFKKRVGGLSSQKTKRQKSTTKQNKNVEQKQQKSQPQTLSIQQQSTPIMNRKKYVPPKPRTKNKKQQSPKSKSKSKQPSEELMNRLINGSKAKISKKQMHALTKKNYEKLPQVLQKKKEQKKRIEELERKNRIKSYQKQIRGGNSKDSAEAKVKQ